MRTMRDRYRRQGFLKSRRGRREPLLRSAMVCRMELLEPRLLLDGVGPRVLSMLPAPDATAASDAAVVLEFDTDIDPGTLNEFTLDLTASGGDGTFADGNEVPVQGTVSYDPGTRTATFTPAGLLGGDTYQVFIDGTVVADLDGDLLDGEYTSTFPTGDGNLGGDFAATFSVNMPQVSGNYTTDVTWASGVFYLYNDITLYEDATLTLMPGVVVKGRYVDDYYDDRDVASELKVSGTLDARGTEEYPIIFTSIQDDWHGGDSNGDGTSTMPSGRDWGGIRLYGGSSASVLNHTEILYAGCDNINHGSNYGITVSDGATPTISNSRIISGGLAAIYLELLADPALSNLELDGYSINGAQLESGTIDADMAWNDPDVTYYLDNDVTVASGATLTISPGMVIKGRYLDDYYDDRDVASELKVNGTLLAMGTEELPIVFTSFWDDVHGGDTNNDGNSSTPSGCNWGGIRLYGGSSASVLNHTEILYAGCDNINHGSNYGITVSDGATPTISNSRIISGGLAAIYLELLADPALSNLELDGYSINGAQLESGTIDADMAWNDPDVTYYLDNDVTVASGATLTISPGMVIKGRYLDDYYDDRDVASELKVNGTLLAMGTEELPIVFTSLSDDWHGGDTNNDGNSSTPARGGWGGLRIYSSSSDTSVMDHVQVWYGGRDNIDAGTTDAVIFSGSSPSFTNGAVMYALEDGIVMSDDESHSAISNGLFAYNSGTGIKVTSNASGEFVNNTFNANNGGVLCDAADWSVVRNNIFSNDSGTAVRFQNGALGQVEYNLFWDNTTDTSGISPDPIGVNGNAVGDPLYRDLSVHDHRLRDGSAAIDAGTSIGAPSTDQLGNLRYDDPNVANTGFGIFPYYDIGAYERQSPSRPIDLVMDQVITLPSVSVNDPVPVQYRVRNTGENPAVGEWTDAIFLSADPVWDVNDLFMGSLTHYGGLAPDRTYDGGLAVDIPGALEGDYYLIVKTDHGDDLRSHVVEVDEENNWLPSDPISLTIPELTLGVAMDGQFEADDVAKYYKVVSMRE